MNKSSSSIAASSVLWCCCVVVAVVVGSCKGVGFASSSRSAVSSFCSTIHPPPSLLHVLHTPHAAPLWAAASTVEEV